MKGASEYASLFETAQYGKLYLVSGYHARGRTFRIFVVPTGVQIDPNKINGPQRSDCIEVFGVIGGNPGWTEFYGWKYEGPWQEDFYKLVEDRKAELEKIKAQKEEALILREKANEEKILSHLAAYGGVK